ncbi:MAG: efflux RND transporter permease subunit, partial [Flavobacteriia bacterium]|nr:efflux RND transporter permease subunit [Flavobacteriia bacterium]
MTLTELSIKRPSFIIVVFTILIGGGLICYNQLSYELMPDFSPPVLTVTTTYPGASPATVESQVSKPLEDGLSGIENLSEVTTFSLENASIVLLEFKDGVDINLALQEAQRKINTIESGLPDNSSRPVLAKIEPNATPVLQIIATADKINGKAFMTLMDDQILPQIKQVSGVAEVQVIGGEKREIRVNADKEKLRAYGLSLANVNQAIAAANVEFPTGKVKSNQEQMTVRLSGKFKTVDDLKNLILFSTGSSVVRLGDVADVSDSNSDQLSLCRLNGKEGIGLRIKKQSDANAVSMSEFTRKRLKELEGKYKNFGVKFTVATDTSTVTMESVNAVLHDLELAIFLVALVMLLFLHTLRNALIVLVSIPASLITTFIAMY